MHGCHCLCLLWLTLLMVSVTQARYIAEEVKESEEDDIDLEKVMQDYYDNLMELWTGGMEEKSDEDLSEKGNATKPKRAKRKKLENYDYQLDRSAVESPSDNMSSIVARARPFAIGNTTVRLLEKDDAERLERLLAERGRDFESDNATRHRELRLTSIKESLLRLRDNNATFRNPLSSKPDQLESIERRMSEIEPNNQGEIRLNFYPSCHIPRNVTNGVWENDEHSMNMLFDVLFPQPPPETTFMVIDAYLLLYTISESNSTSPMDNPQIKMDQTSIDLLSEEDVKRIRISVYWYTRRSKKTKDKVKKLLDSKMTSLQDRKALKFEIKTAVRGWKQSRKNFGLMVTVEDEDSKLLKASDYIHPMNCSKGIGTLKPFPILNSDYQSQYVIQLPSAEGNDTDQDTPSVIFSDQPARFPILILRMMGVSKSRMENWNAVKTAHMELNSTYYSGASKNSRKQTAGEFAVLPHGVPLSRLNSSSTRTKLEPVASNEASHLRFSRKLETEV